MRMRTSDGVHLGAAITLCWAWVGAAPGVEITLNPEADAFVSAAHPSSNYGAAGAVAVSAAGLAKGEFQSVLRFEAAPAKTAFDTAFGVGQWQVESVSLQLTAALANNAIFNGAGAGEVALAWIQNDSWTEGTGSPSSPSASGITFDTLPSFLGVGDEALGTFSFDGRTSGSVLFKLGVSPGLASDVLAGEAASLRLSAANATVSGVFNARNFGQAPSRPALVITAVPVPEPVTILLAAIGSLFFLFRRRGS